jgi:hypothetical protein
VRTGDPGSDPMLCVLGGLVVDMLAVPTACTRVGADPPTRAELDAARSAR